MRGKAASSPLASGQTAEIYHRHLDQLFDRLDAYDAVFVAVSGGADSMALLHLLLDWRRAGGRAWTADRIIAVTVDHALRPELALEADRVAAWCRAVGVGHLTLRWKGPKPATGVQQAAREARYRLLRAHIEEHLAGLSLGVPGRPCSRRTPRTTRPRRC